MARKADKRAAKSQNGVSDNGGSGEGNGSGDNTGSGPAGDGGSGSGDGDGSVIRPTLDGAGNADSGGDGGTGSGDIGKRGRGRPAGSTGKKKAEISVTTLAEVIAFAHVGIATVFKNDAWSLDDGESKRLAEAGAKVLRHYDTPAVSAQAMDWIGLVMVAGNIYGPRIVLSVASTPSPAQAARSPQEPKTPMAEQDDGYVTITDPMGSGKIMRVPVTN